MVYVLVGLLYTPVLLYQAVVQGKNRQGWRERFGGVPQFTALEPGQGATGIGVPSSENRTGHQSRIWIHAVSLGEINATPRLVEELREALPGCDIVVSSTTDTGYARGVALYGREQVFRFPLDFSLVIDRALRRVRPSMIVLIELEVWFNLIRAARRRGIPVVVVNGRLTEHSARRFRLLGLLVRPMFEGLTWVGAQDEVIAGRFRSLGVPADRVEVTSSLKWDTAPASERVEGADALATAMGINPETRLWVCGSTGPGEEEMLLDVYERIRTRVVEPVGAGADASVGGSGEHKSVALALVPRKPERFDEVARLIERRRCRCVRRSQCPDDGSRGPAHEDDGRGVVYLGDTMGELRKFYSLADVVFVGRSMVPLGGSDPMEAAALGKAIVVGPHMENFASPVQALDGVRAIRIVRTVDELAEAVSGLLADDDGQRELGGRAREVVRANQGATRRTVERLVEVVGGRRDGGES
jgi:3-deoxy-D-manno-octulosonic-acid transferase